MRLCVCLHLLLSAGSRPSHSTNGFKWTLRKHEFAMNTHPATLRQLCEHKERILVVVGDPAFEMYFPPQQLWKLAVMRSR
jgi:hypothetical protein